MCLLLKIGSFGGSVRVFKLDIRLSVGEISRFLLCGRASLEGGRTLYKSLNIKKKRCVDQARLSPWSQQLCPMACVNNLPDGFVNHIIGNLSLSDLKSLRLTCRIMADRSGVRKSLYAVHTLRGKHALMHTRTILDDEIRSGLQFATTQNERAF
jgi:hypothetical protein